MIIALILIGWYLSGVLSFVFWWTRDYDLTTEELLMMLCVGIGGPITFLYGFHIHGRKSTQILIKKRGDKHV